MAPHNWKPSYFSFETTNSMGESHPAEHPKKQIKYPLVIKHGLLQKKIHLVR